MRGQVLVAVGALAASLAASPILAQPAFAGPSNVEVYQPGPTYEDVRRCQQERNARTAGGAVIGAILGAVIGNNVAHDQSDGSVGGAVLGGIAGGAIGRGSARCDANVPQGDAYYGGDDRYDPRYAGPEPRDLRGPRDDRDLRGGPYEYGPRYAQNSCEWRTMRYRDDYGRPRSERVRFCQGRDGRWRPDR
ncbi:MAG: glycine zipper family protein [Hyphomonadaceae bacterium]|nr:glycine zipper family protein [Hyphomonadaceae bacterium]